MTEPHLAGITRYPVKSLDGEKLSSATLEDKTGAIRGDREYAIVDAAGDYVNGKRTAAVHAIRASYDDGEIELAIPGNPVLRTDLESGTDRIAKRLRDWFEIDVELIRQPAGGFPDDTALSGPTVISTATLETVASWFPDIGVSDMRQRFRANLEIGGVPAFWEDRLFADHGEVIRFRIGDTPIDGVSPCSRCVVPARDPRTGEETPDFRRRFSDHRAETKPSWLDSDRFDHDFRLMVNTRVPEKGRGTTIDQGDPVECIGTRPE